MKISSFFFFISFLVTVGYSQGTWTQLSSIPGPGRHHACSFVLGDSAYVATGSGLADFYKYDIYADTWTQLPDFPGGGRNFAIGFAINGKGYISCGFNGSSANMEIWEFDPASGGWTQKTSGPAIGRVHPAFSVVGDRVYIGQGQQDGNFADLDDWYEYNATTDTWTQKTDFMSLRHHGAGATVGNVIYVGTGHHLDTMHDDWYAYNADTDSWEVKSDFTGAGRSAGNAVARLGKVYYLAGEDEINFARFDDFREYDPVTDSWSTLTSFPADGRWAPFMFVHNDTIYAGAGEDNQLNVRNDLWRYDFSTADLIENLSEKSHPVYPNPASSSIIIPGKEKVGTIHIYALDGTLVSKEEAKSNYLSVEHLKPGLYVLKILESGYVSKLRIER